MPRAEAHTRERIILAALALFAERGIATTSLNKVARRARVTRLTVYRHFQNKEGLVKEAFLRTEQVFIGALEELTRDPRADWQSAINEIGERLSALPSGDVFARAEELRQLYPAAYAAVQEVRISTLNGLFGNVFARLKRQGRLRPGLNQQLFQAVFWELVTDIFDNPRFRSLGLTGGDLYHGMTDILLYGIIQDK